jgi:hypothetical protein
MNEMKKQALEKLMMVLDDVLGGDVKERLAKGEKPSIEVEMEGEEEGEDKDEEVASGGSSILSLPEAGEEEMPEGKEKGKPAGVGVEVEKVAVAAMPKPGLMRKMKGMKE